MQNFFRLLAASILTRTREANAVAHEREARAGQAQEAGFDLSFLDAPYGSVGSPNRGSKSPPPSRSYETSYDPTPSKSYFY